MNSDLTTDEHILERVESILHKISRDRQIMAGVAVLALLAAVLFGNAYFNQQDTIDENRVAICATAESLINAMIEVSTPPVDEAARVLQQRRLDAYESSLERRLAALDCDLHLTILTVPGG